MVEHKLLDTNIKSAIIDLRKKGRSENKDYLVAMSEMLDTARRRRVSVNILKLNILAKKHKGKVFLVPGTVLGYGKLEMPVNVYAFKYSKGAEDKIKAMKGSAKDLANLVSDNLDSSSVVLVR